MVKAGLGRPWAVLLALALALPSLQLPQALLAPTASPELR